MGHADANEHVEKSENAVLPVDDATAAAAAANGAARGDNPIDRGRDPERHELAPCEHHPALQRGLSGGRRPGDQLVAAVESREPREAQVAAEELGPDEQSVLADQGLLLQPLPRAAGTCW